MRFTLSFIVVYFACAHLLPLIPFVQKAVLYCWIALPPLLSISWGCLYMCVCIDIYTHYIYTHTYIYDFFSNLYAQCGARTHKLKIKSCTLCLLSQLSAPKLGVVVCGCFWILASVLLIYMSVPPPAPRSLDYSDHKVVCPTLFFFLKIVIFL